MESQVFARIAPSIREFVPTRDDQMGMLRKIAENGETLSKENK